MAELADAPDLGSGGHSRAGSSPVIRIERTLKISVLFTLCCIIEDVNSFWGSYQIFESL